MKYIYIVLIVLLPLLAFGQDDNSDSSKIDKVFKELNESWNLGIIDENSSTNIWLYNKFKSLFDSSATIDDEFNARFKFDKDKNASYYELDRNLKFYEYAHSIIFEIAKLNIDTIIIIDPPINKPFRSNNNNIYIYKIVREVQASKKRLHVLPQGPKDYFDELIAYRKKIKIGETDKLKVYKDKLYNTQDEYYDFQSKDTLLITLQKINDEFKITKIERLSKNNTILCLNDRDSDGILDAEEDALLDKTSKDFKLDYTQGDFTAKGIKDYDLDTIADIQDICKCRYGLAWNKGCPWYFFRNRLSWQGFVGVRINAVPLHVSSIMDSGYDKDKIDALLSDSGSISKPNHRVSFAFGTDASYYFGEKKNMGLSIGFNYSFFDAIYQFDKDAIYTFRSNDGENDYRRKITIRKDSKETLQYQLLNFPLLLKHRGRIGGNKDDKEKKSSFEISAGPSMLFYLNSSNYNVKMDFEGLYQVDPLTYSIIYDHNFDYNSTYNIILTGEEINQQSSIPGVNKVFENLNSKGYDFEKGKTFEGTDEEVDRLSVAWNANLDYSYQINNIILKIGLGVIYSQSKKSVSDYTPMDNSKQVYQSIFKSSAPFKLFSYGVNVGFAVGL